MKAAIYKKKGPAKDVLKVVEKNSQDPHDNEVRVKLVYSGINPSDVKTRSGKGARSDGYPEVIPHSDGSGTIDKVGSQISNDMIGKRVWIFNGQWGRPFGTAAEYITIPSKQVVILPDSISFETGATIGIPLMTAMHCIQTCNIILDKTILVPGAAGCVGFYVTQLASLAGAKVIAIVSNSEKELIAKNIGATEIINYKKDSVVEKVKKITDKKKANIIIDVDASSYANLYGELLCFQGKAIIYGSNEPIFNLKFGPMILNFISIYNFMVYKLPEFELKKVLDSINSFLVEPSFKHPKIKIFKLDEIADAHEFVEKGSDSKVLIEL